jgi:hypothetical protein
MCTTIANTIAIRAAAKGRPGWFPVTQATVAYDHPAYSGDEHAFLVDFANYDLDVAARVAVELDLDSARALLRELTAAIAAAEASGLAAAPAADAPAAAQGAREH